MDKIDRNIIALCDVLNSFEGVETFGSCGGHKNPKPGQWGAGNFYVKFNIEWDESGLFALEYLAWLVNEAFGDPKHKLILYPFAPPPYLNNPGKGLCFVLEGHGGMKPGELARFMIKIKNETFIPHDDPCLSGYDE